MFYIDKCTLYFIAKIGKNQEFIEKKLIPASPR